MTETIPARILIQIREGVPNELTAFDLPVHGSEPLDPKDPGTLEGAKLGHKVDTRDIISGLAGAQHKLVQQLRDEGAYESNKKWLRKLAAWVVAR